MPSSTSLVPTHSHSQQSTQLHPHARFAPTGLRVTAAAAIAEGGFAPPVQVPRLLMPDPLAPRLAPLDAATIQKLMAGTFVPASKMLRQQTRTASAPQALSFATVASQADPSATATLALTSGVPQRPRQLATGHDWFEAMLSAFLPALVLAAQQLLPADATSVPDDVVPPLQQTLERLRQTSVYLLHAHTMFARMSAEDTIAYLETHRLNCLQSGAELSSPDYDMLMNIRSSSSAAGSGSSSSSSSSASATGAAHGSTQSPGPQICGRFNTPKGCPFAATCKYTHVCLTCKQAGHPKQSCTAPAAPKKR